MAVSFALMEGADAFMDKVHSPGSMVILLCVILVFSLTALFEKMIEISFGEERIRSDRRIRQREQEVIVYFDRYREKISKKTTNFEALMMHLRALGAE